MTEIVDIDHAKELDAFVSSHEYAHFMQTSAWGRVKKDWGWKGIICRDDRGQICGTIALLQHNIRHTGTCMLYAPRGPIFDHDNFPVFDELIQAAKKLAKECHAYLLRVDPMFEEGSEEFLRQAESLGFHCKAALDFSLFQPRMCYVLDLDGLTDETLISQYHRSTRRHLNLALRSGVTVRQGTIDDLPRFSCMMEQVAQKNSFTARKEPYFRDFLQGLGDHAKLYLAEFEGNVIAGSISVIWGNRAWFMYGCSDVTARKEHPTELLQYHMQRDAIAAGCRWFDFRGVEGYPVEDNPKLGLHQHKQGFGAKFQAYVGQLDLTLRPVMGKLVNLMMRIVSR